MNDQLPPGAWTPSEVDTLTRLFRSGQSYSELAKSLGKPYDAIKSKIYRLKLRRGAKLTWSPEDERRLIEMWATDMPAREIGQRLGRNKYVVGSKARRLGLRDRSYLQTLFGRRASVWNDEKERRLRNLWMAGKWPSEIAKAVGVADSTVRKKAAEMGLPQVERGGTIRVAPKQYRSRTPAPKPAPKINARPVQSREDERRAIEEAIAAGAVTKCPPAYVAPVRGADALEGVVSWSPAGKGQWQSGGFRL